MKRFMMLSAAACVLSLGAFADRRRRLLRSLLIAADDRDAGARFSEGVGDGATDAAGAPGD